MVIILILYFSILLYFVKSVNENDFNYLIQLNMMPQDMRSMLISGFPRGFIGGKYGVGIIPSEYSSSTPVRWYAPLWTSADQLTKCDLARDYPFNCFLFNVMAVEFVEMLRFSMRGPKHLAPDPKDLTVNFIFQYCRMRTMSNTTSFDPRGYCPNPCFNKTIYCELKKNTKDGSCEIDSNNRYRVDGFKCVCKIGYIWSVTERYCISNSSSVRSTELGCVRNGTDSVSNSADQGFLCKCKKNYFGKLCEYILNACKNPISDKIAGNSACRVSKGNVCISSNLFHPTTDPFYQCQCTENYRRNITFPQDNCLYEYKACEKWICVKGICVAKSSGNVGYCICDRGWTGAHCDILTIIDSLTPWNQWSICRPICGESRLRHRRRFCLRTPCEVGHTEDLRPCRSRSCHRYHHPDSRDKFIMDVQLFDDARPEIDYFTLGMVVTVIANMLLAAIFIQWRLFSPFLKLVATRKIGMKKSKDSSKPPDEESSVSEAPQ